MKISINILSQKSIKAAIKQLEAVKAKIPNMLDELLMKSCERIIEGANRNLDVSGLNQGFIQEIKEGWQPIVKAEDGTYKVINRGRGYSAEFGIGIVGQGSYKGDLPPEYKYNVQTRYKKADGSWIFRVSDLDTLDITEENVLPNQKTGEINYEEGRTIRTQGQRAVMFLFNAILDFKMNNTAKEIWQGIKERHIG